jgi:hypothetical protein
MYGQGYGQGMYGQQGFGGYGQSQFIPDTWTFTEYYVVPTGPMSGVGPQGYQRSDERIKEDIHERLTRHGHLNASNVQVHVHSGDVTLQGNVPSKQEKRSAADIAESVSGVQSVHNELNVQQPATSQTGQPSGTSATGSSSQYGQPSQTASSTSVRR